MTVEVLQVKGHIFNRCESPHGQGGLGITHYRCQNCELIVYERDGRNPLTTSCANTFSPQDLAGVVTLSCNEFIIKRVMT